MMPLVVGRRVVLNQRLVKERDSARGRDLRRVLWISGALLAPVLFYVWQQMEYIRYGHRLEQLRSESVRLTEENRKLRVERAMLLDLGRIERVALENLGLVPPSAENTIKVRLTGESVSPGSLAKGRSPAEGLLAAER